MMKNKNLPTISNYGDYSSSNYGAHSLKVSFDNLDLYYSYETVVAFNFNHLVVSENCWGTTTGKHLNWINSDKKERIPRDQFENQLSEVLTKLGLSN